jgi:phosphate acetyltransferase
MKWIENRTFDELKTGDSAKLKRTLTQKDIELFSIMSGDVNPAHVDADFAKDDMFHRIIAQGMWGASLISAVLGTELPGPGTIYLDQTLKFSAPVIPGDTITIVVTVLKKHPEKHIVDLDCQCINQDGKVVTTGIATVIAPSKKVKRERIKLPQVVLQEPKDSWYKQLMKLKNDYQAITTAVVHPVDALSLQGAIDAAEEKLIRPILVGPKDKIQQAAKDANIDISAYEILPTRHSNESAEIAVKIVREGRAEAIMKGKIAADELMKVLIDKVNGLRTGRRISHVFAMKIANHFKPLFLTDAVINIQPNLQNKKDIVQNAIDLFCGLGLGQPKVAILSALDIVNDKIPSTLDATALSKMAERGQITGGLVDGPLSFDNALSMESAREKGIISQVAGDADIVVVPDIESGNLLYKQMTSLSGIEAAGILLGARVPIILTLSSATEPCKASCAMALIYARNKSTRC